KERFPPTCYFPSEDKNFPSSGSVWALKPNSHQEVLATICESVLQQLEDAFVRRGGIIVEPVHIQPTPRRSRMLKWQGTPDAEERRLIGELPVTLCNARAHHLVQCPRQRARHTPAARSLRERHHGCAKHRARKRATCPLPRI